MGHGSCFPRQNTFDRQLFSIGSTAESHFQPFLHARLSQSDKINANLGEADRPTKLSLTIACHNYSIHASYLAGGQDRRGTHGLRDKLSLGVIQQLKIYVGGGGDQLL